tara:strand:+ start:950 stop:1396 length:447 start_codon:yes stop_codon:yes gene_type:complete
LAYATIADLLEIDPTIQEYGVLDFDAELAKSETEINRLLSIRWFPSYHKNRTDIRYSDLAVIMDPTKLTDSQWTKATAFHALAYHICPKLTKHEADPDRFRMMMDYYEDRFEKEFDLCVRQGVEYDANNDGIVQDVEKTADVFLRLRR